MQVYFFGKSYLVSRLEFFFKKLYTFKQIILLQIFCLMFLILKKYCFVVFTMRSGKPELFRVGMKTSTPQLKANHNSIAKYMRLGHNSFQKKLIALDLIA